jgi:hypothetical protein
VMSAQPPPVVGFRPGPMSEDITNAEAAGFEPARGGNPQPA